MHKDNKNRKEAMRTRGDIIKKTRLSMFLLLLTVTLFAVEPIDRSTFTKEDCSNNWKGVYKVIDSKIGESNFSIKSDIECRDTADKQLQPRECHDYNWKKKS